MTNDSMRMRCPNCNVRIRASLRLCGRRRNCPKCLQAFRVPRTVQKDTGPLMVLTEQNEYFELAVVHELASPRTSQKSNLARRDRLAPA